VPCPYVPSSTRKLIAFTTHLSAQTSAEARVSASASACQDDAPKFRGSGQRQPRRRGRQSSRRSAPSPPPAASAPPPRSRGAPAECSGQTARAARPCSTLAAPARPSAAGSSSHCSDCNVDAFQVSDGKRDRRESAASLPEGEADGRAAVEVAADADVLRAHPLLHVREVVGDDGGQHTWRVDRHALLVSRARALRPDRRPASATPRPGAEHVRNAARL